MRVSELYGNFFCIWPDIKQGVINADHVFFLSIGGGGWGGGGGSTRQKFGYR